VELSGSRWGSPAFSTGEFYPAGNGKVLISSFPVEWYVQKSSIGYIDALRKAID